MQATATQSSASVMRVVLAVVLCVVAMVSAPTASALPPSPFCPGDGVDVSVLGAGGGYCDFLFLPDGTHVHCEFGGVFIVLVDIVSVSNCWRVNADGTRVPPAPLVRDDPWSPPLLVELPPPPEG